jgi:hypothetical protein
MSKKNKKTDPIPENFSNMEAAAAFWDTHSLTDYLDEMSEIEIDVRAPRRQWVPLASTFAEQIIARAKKEGVSVETLVNLWVSEKLQADAG